MKKRMSGEEYLEFLRRRHPLTKLFIICLALFIVGLGIFRPLSYASGIIILAYFIAALIFVKKNM